MESFRKSFLTTQPGKAIWALLAVTFNLVRLPLWLLYFVPRSLRQHPKWSHRQAVRVRILETFLYHASVVEMKTPLSLEPGKEKDQFTVVSPSKQPYYTGIVSQDPEVKPERVGGTWYPAHPTAHEKPGTVVLHFHGGAFVIGDGRIQDAGFAAKKLIENTEASHVFAPQYRLASNPGGRFPAALQDAITTYAYLVDEMNVPAHKIIVSGDSAGGNLVVGLLRYIKEYGAAKGMPSPGCAWLWSPWVSPVVSLEPDAIERNPNKPTDYLYGGFGSWGAHGLRPLPSTGIGLSDPYISPLGHPFKSETPIYISTGECEVLMYDDVKMYEELKGVEGNKVQLQMEEYAIHDIILVGRISGFDKEAERAAKRAGDWTRQVMSSSSKL